jgi:hypothetical protein
MENIEILNSGGLKCDNPTCDWQDMTIPVEDYEKWVNQPCPKCGENVLTEQDYDNSQVLLASIALLNSFSQSELEELARSIHSESTIEALKENPFFAQAEGLSELNSEGKVLIRVDTHKEIKVTNIKNVDTLFDNDSETKTIEP